SSYDFRAFDADIVHSGDLPDLFAVRESPWGANEFPPSSLVGDGAANHNATAMGSNGYASIQSTEHDQRGPGQFAQLPLDILEGGVSLDPMYTGGPMAQDSLLSTVQGQYGPSLFAHLPFNMFEGGGSLGPVDTGGPMAQDLYSTNAQYPVGLDVPAADFTAQLGLWDMPLLPPPAATTDAGILEGLDDNPGSSLTGAGVAPQGGVHRHNTRSQRRNEPYPMNQAAASGADLTHNNTISTGAARKGGARSTGAGRTKLSRPRTETETEESGGKTKKRRGPEAEHIRTCKVEGCVPKQKTKAGKNKAGEHIFATKSSLVRHIGREHQKTEVQCPRCGKVVSRKDSFKRHWKRFHDVPGKKPMFRDDEYEEDEEDEEEDGPPDAMPSGIHKRRDEEDDQDFGGKGGMGLGQWSMGEGIHAY
ncbi:unnamed protein product, partial [Peniophora sp. CBMAI 1063]